MNYIIITSENFADIEKVRNNARNAKIESYKINAFDNYAHGSFAVIGAEAIEMFCNKYGFNITNQEIIKTDGKTKAELIPYITPDYYYDARNDKGGITNIFPHTIIGNLVKYNDVLLESYKIHYNSEMREFRLFNDNTDYRNYLPSNWEKENPQPKNVGVITDKKMADWVNWLLSRKSAAESAKMAKENKVSIFLNKIRGFNTSVCKDFRVGENSGFFEANGLRYSYAIDKSGYISEKIELCYSSANVDTLDKFNMMISGNFK